MASARDLRARVRLDTNFGPIVVALANETPLHRDNFLKLTRAGFYDGLTFHRVISEFMIQSGDGATRAKQNDSVTTPEEPSYTIAAEIHYPALFHKRGALCAAREPDEVNPDLDSSGSQFYIVWGKTYTLEKLAPIARKLSIMSRHEFDMTPEIRVSYETEGGTPWLDGSYTVFGEVVEGLKIVKKIQAVKTDAQDRPLEDVRILRATVIQEPQSKDKKKRP